MARRTIPRVWGISRISNRTVGWRSLTTKRQARPQAREKRRQITVQIKRLVGDSPTRLMEQLFQQKAGDPLQSGGEDHRAHKQEKKVVLERLQTGQDNDGAESVHRAPWAVQKPAVDKFPGDGGGKAYLGTRAQKGVEKEKPEEIVTAWQLLSGGSPRTQHYTRFQRKSL